MSSKLTQLCFVVVLMLLSVCQAATTTTTKAPAAMATPKQVATTTKTTVQPKQLSPTTTTTAKAAKRNPICEQPLEIGPCRMRLERFYYDSKTNSCQKFTFGGCHGNENRFGFEETCNKTCKQ